MAGEVADIKRGFANALDNISGLARIYTYDPESPHDYPFAVIKIAERSQLTLGGSSFEAAVRISVVAGPGMSERVAETIDSFLDPTGPQSIEAALESDRTLGGNIDSLRLESIGEANYRPFPFNETEPLYAVDFIFVIQKTVTT